MWKNVIGYEGYYKVSDEGEIKRIKCVGHGSRIRILQPSDNGNGYNTVMFCKNGITRRKYVHQIVAEAFIGKTDNTKQVNHKDGDRKNNKVQNLEYVTCKENIIHSRRILGKSIGSIHYKSISAETLNQINTLLAQGIYQRIIAKETGVSIKTVASIAQKKHWSNR